MKIKYLDLPLRASRLALIETASELLQDFYERGLPKTLRGLHYLFVARDLYPEEWAREVEDRESGAKSWTTNNQQSYDKLGELVNDGRIAGLIDWDAMEDITRRANTVSYWSNPGGMIRTAANAYAVNMWEGQDVMAEVWVEKDAMKRVIARAANSVYVPHLSARGYPSQTLVWDAAQRLIRYLKTGHKEVVIFHNGDHDPSGLDMTRDIFDRLSLFMGPYAGKLRVERLSLNLDQVRQYNPPENFAKLSDGRAKEYIKKYGNKSWELDALDDEVLIKLIQDAVISVRDPSAFEAAKAKLKTDKVLMEKASVNWGSVAAFLEGKSDITATAPYPPVALHAMLREYEATADVSDFLGMLRELGSYVDAVYNGDRDLSGNYYEDEE